MNKYADQIREKSLRTASKLGISLTDIEKSDILHMSKGGYEVVGKSAGHLVFSWAEDQQFWTIDDWKEFEQDCGEQDGAYSSWYPEAP